MNETLSFPYRTLADALLAAPDELPFVTMWRDEDDYETVTFGEFKTLAARQSAVLRQAGVCRGQTVIIVQPQGIELMASFAGALLLGAVPAILAYPTFKVDPAKYRFGLMGVSKNLKASAVLVDQEFPQDLLAKLWVGDETRLIRTGSADSANYREFDPAGDPDDIAFIQHSAGTTGLQKGVALSHSAVLRHLNALAKVLRLTASDSIYSWLPLYHDMGLIACFVLPMVAHLPVAMQSPAHWVMQPKSMLQVITRFRSSLAWLPNFSFQFVARRADEYDSREFDLSPVRALINCSEPVRASSMEEFRTAFQPCGLRDSALQSSYAMAETVFAVSQSPLEGTGPLSIFADGELLRREHRIREVDPSTPGALSYMSSGRLLPACTVRIVGENGVDLADGAVGEIAIKSGTMLTGYYNRPDLTANAVRDGWYFSGDLGFKLGEELFVTGRKKDLIIVGGENIYPQDVEEIVSSHPAIHDGRVIAMGLYNAKLGTEEIVVVAEVRDEASLADSARIERELLNSIVAELGVAARMVYLKPPKWIVKSTAGKPARSTTREKLLNEHQELRILIGGTTEHERSSTAAAN
jgi:fatty-acyl-CoA synthase